MFVTVNERMSTMLRAHCAKLLRRNPVSYCRLRKTECRFSSTVDGVEQKNRVRVCLAARFGFSFGVGQGLVFSDFSADRAIPNLIGKIIGCVLFYFGLKSSLIMKSVTLSVHPLGTKNMDPITLTPESELCDLAQQSWVAISSAPASQSDVQQPSTPPAPPASSFLSIPLRPPRMWWSIEMEQALIASLQEATRIGQRADSSFKK